MNCEARMFTKNNLSGDHLPSPLDALAQEKSLKIHEWERYGYLHLFSMNWQKIFPYIGKSVETSFPYLGIVWVFKFNRFLSKAHGMGIY